MRTVGLEVVPRAGIRSAQTSATGANYTQLADLECKQVVIYNNTGTTLEVRYCNPADGSAKANEATLQIANGIAQPLRGLNNAKQIAVRRADSSNTQVTASYTWEGI